MSDPRPIFRATSSGVGPRAAFATMTVVGAVLYTLAHCPYPCNRGVMSIPGVVQVEVRVVASNAERSGRGRCCKCPKCRRLVEVIEHG